MENYLSYLVAVHILGSFALAYAALQRTVSFWLAFLISLVLTPVVGFLFVLCYPTYVEEDTKKYLKKLLENKVVEERN
jgi:hypothetical protein